VIQTDERMTSLGGERACTLTARAIADIVGGELRGDDTVTVGAIAPIARASSSELTFVAQTRYAADFRDSRAGVVLVIPDLADAPSGALCRIVVDNPQECLLALIPKLYPENDQEPRISSTARIGKGARIGSRVSLDDFAVIGAGAVLGDGVRVGAHAVIGDGVTIGERSWIYPNVTIYSGTQVGARVRLHAGVVLGSDGYGYVFRGGAHEKIPHVGRCLIGNDVEIGANTTIDRGSIDDTVIGDGTKIDNLVQIGHNVKIGSLCLIMSQVGVSGSTCVGDGAVLAGQAGIGGHLTIGAGARVGGQSGVFGDVPAGETWSGYPARPHRESLRATAALLKLPAMLRKLELLLEKKNGS
jgi:UDP-3-O-[3-hydroxymyristoyl] glucosamine N-acyltransferase